MAELIGNNKQIGDDDEKHGQSAVAETPGTSSAGFISGAGGSSSQSQQTGPGGTGGWTNIQSYLNANKGGTGSERLLQDKVGNAFNQESSNIKSTASSTKEKANEQSNKITDASKNAQTWVNQAADAYGWGTNGKAYDENVRRMDDALYSTYAGPNSYDYTLGSQVQRYGSALKENDSFGHLVTDLQREAAGGSLTRGGGDLQRQLDVNNEALTNTRQDLLRRYAGLDEELKEAATETGTAIQTARTNYGNVQSALADQLSNYASQLETARAKAESDARSSYERELNSGSGHKNYYVQGIGSDFFAPNPNDIRAAGNDATWKQIAEYTMPGVSIEDWNPYKDRGNSAINEANQLNQRSKDALNAFYQATDAKYAGTGDVEKRRFNTIMDILNQNTQRSKGFSVRGNS